MTLVARPNTWVAIDAAATTVLAYAPRVDPAPWTVSVPGKDSRLASIQVVITNASSKPAAVNSIDFSFTVGQTSTDLTPTTAGVSYDVSDASTWQVSGPAHPITSGKATYTLGPVTGATATLAPGASVVVELYQIQTGQSPGTAAITVKEMIEGQAPGFTTFAVTTFPDGFYFDGLVACAQQGSALVPVAQVAANTPVTLVWNASAADVSAVDVYWSDATSGQQHATPGTFDQWTSPPLTSDTSFVVVVTAKGSGGAPLTAALATGVSVQNPALIAGSLTARQVAVAGAATFDGTIAANGITATSLAVNGNLSATAATVNGPLTTNGATVNGDLRATGAVSAGGPIASASGTSSVAALNVGGAVQAGTVQGTTLNVTNATVSTALTAKQSTVAMVNPAGPLGTGQYFPHTDGFVIGVVGWPDSANPGCVGYAAAVCGDLKVLAVGGNLGAFGPAWRDFQASNGNTFTLPVAYGSTFNLYAWQTNGGLHQADAPIWFYWVRLGTEHSGMGCERIGPAPELDPPISQARPDAEVAPLRVVGVLERLLERSIGHEDKEELVAALREL